MKPVEETYQVRKVQKKKKKARMQGTKQIMCGKLSPWNRETPRQDTEHTVQGVLRTLRSSFLSFSLAADESQKNDWGKSSLFILIYVCFCDGFGEKLFLGIFKGETVSDCKAIKWTFKRGQEIKSLL